MSASRNYSKHVSFYNLTDMPESSQIWDTAIATQFIPFSLISTIGNIFAFRYFLSRPVKSVPTTLYIFITIVDLGTGMAHFPVAGALFNQRRPWLFNIQEFCTFWTIVYSFLQKFSMFLVMLLTASRTIKIVFPFARVRKTVVIITLALYGLSLLASDIIVANYGMNFVYSSDSAYCYEFYGSYYERNAEIATILKVANFRFVLQVGIPPVVIFLSFVISVAKLYFLAPAIVRTPYRSIRGEEKNKKLQASITITLITGLFLMSNSLFFITKCLESVTYFTNLSYPGPFFRTNFMFWYSWPLGKVYFTVLNATLNPVLYYYRIDEFRNWVWSVEEQEELYSSADRRCTAISVVADKIRRRSTLV
jgi:hypothetical protein